MQNAEGGGPSTLCIRGSVYQGMGPLIPEKNGHPGSAQLYIRDNGLANWQGSIPGLDPTNVAELQHMLHTSKTMQSFKTFAQSEPTWN